MQKRQELLKIARSVLQHFSSDGVKNELGSPVFLISSPRAGSTLLFEQLQRIPGVWSIGSESHFVFNLFPELRAENSAMDSGALNEQHAHPVIADLMRACFLFLSRDYQGKQYLRPDASEPPNQLNLIEKTPRNALNIPFLKAVFPKARFIYLYRDPKENIASIAEAWRVGLESGQFVTYRQLPDWDRAAWCLLLPRGWRNMVGRSLVDIAGFQWVESNLCIINELSRLNRDRWTSLSYRDLVDNPSESIHRLCEFIGIDNRPTAIDSLPFSKTTVSAPKNDKWKKYEDDILALAHQYEPVMERISKLNFV